MLDYFQRIAPGERFSDGNAETRCILFERWSAAPVIGWLGMNPSFADTDRTDPTWLRWRGFAQRWGYGGQMVCNPVPYRSADPTAAVALLREISLGRADGRMMEENLRRLKEVASLPDLWVVGWGDKGAAMNREVSCHWETLAALRDNGAQGFGVFGMTKSGNPIHVLARGKRRLADDAPVFAYFPLTNRFGARLQHPRDWA